MDCTFMALCEIVTQVTSNFAEGTRLVDLIEVQVLSRSSIICCLHGPLSVRLSDW